MWFAIFLVCFLTWGFMKITDYWNSSKVCLVGKTAIITGGNRGLGLQAAIGLASRGCRVIIACRSNREAAKEKIIKITNNPNIVAKYIDFTSFKSIREFADDINKTETKIDILINNAGISDGRNIKTEDGYKMLYQVNYLSHFLLSHLLLDVLKNAQGRIINVSSISVIFNKLKLETMGKMSDEYNTSTALELYGNTKAALVIMTRQMAKKVEKLGVKCNALHPGCVCTDIFQQMDTVLPKILVKLFYKWANYYFKTPEAGVQLILKMAMSNTYKDLNGAFLWDFYTPKYPSNLYDDNFGEQLWKKTEEWTHLAENEKIK